MFDDATEIARRIRHRETTSVEVVEDHLDRIGSADPRINAVVTLVAEPALAAAADADRRLAAGDRTGPLHGVPFTVKDSLDTAGVATMRGSELFRGRTPDADATAVARIRDAGAILMAKTNLPELSWWTETDNLLTGRTSNPHDPERTPGGSSGGESAAIAAGLSPLGLGSDVAISVRGPAHNTGIAGLKPSRGRVPITGHWPLAPQRYWHVGPMARSVRDLAVALSVLSGPDGTDPYAALRPRAPDCSARPARTVGWIAGRALGPIDPRIARIVATAADALTDLGHVVERIEPPELEACDATALASVLFPPEIVPHVAPHISGRADELHPVTRRLLRAVEVDLDDFVAAQQDVERLAAVFARCFERFDVLLCPVCPIAAPRHRRSHHVIDGVTVPAAGIMRATVPFNLTGLPALSLPFGATSEALPVNVQLVGRYDEDEALLELGARLEGVRGPMPEVPAGGGA